MTKNRAGFTLIELLVVVLIIGILASVAVPSYLKTVETTKADDAVSLVNMIATTNRMFALDHGGVYVTGAFPTGPVPASCGTMVSCTPAATYNNGCYLVACKYLADQNFAAKPYVFWACDPNGGSCGGAAPSLANAKHKAIGAATYQSWGYLVDKSGVITSYGGAPAATY